VPPHGLGSADTPRKPQELPRLRAAIFSDEYNGQRNPVRQQLMRVMLFTMVLLQHAFIARASLFTDFCPTIDAISVPDEANQWDADGFPQFFTIDLSNWKGNTKRRRQVRAPLHAVCALCAASRAARGGAALRRITRRRPATPRPAAARYFSAEPARRAPSRRLLTLALAADGVRRAQRGEPAVLSRGGAHVLAA
jgi:hypothetical protein